MATTPAARPDVIRPSLRASMRHLARCLAFAVACGAPMLAVLHLDWFADTRSIPENVLYWRLVAVIAWYTALGLLCAGLLLRSAWRIRRRGEWPLPDSFVAFPTKVSRGWRVHLESGARAMGALLALAMVVAGWVGMQVPALLFGIGDYRIDAPARCPRAELVSLPDAPLDD